MLPPVGDEEFADYIAGRLAGVLARIPRDLGATWPVAFGAREVRSICPR
jgi:hypothetical protein